MRPTSKQLAARDPALAALFGVAAVGAPPGNFGAEFGDDYYGDPWGDDYGAEFGAAEAAPAKVMRVIPPTHPAHPAHAAHAAHAAAAWHKQRHHMNRALLLEPNAGSSKKIERYTFSINQTLTIGTPLAFSITNNPDTTIRPQRVNANAPTPGFVLISEIKVANVSVTVGGVLDAFQFSSVAVGQSLDMPTLSPANRVTVIGSYTGFIPPGFVLGNGYTLVVSFTGPSQIVA